MRCKRPVRGDRRLRARLRPRRAPSGAPAGEGFSHAPEGAVGLCNDADGYEVTRLNDNWASWSRREAARGPFCGTRNSGY